MVDTTSVGYVPVDKTGDTMIGDLTLSGAPTTDLMASTKKYVDDNISAGDASKALDNLVAVAINTSLISDTDVTDDLGTLAIRWQHIYALSLGTGDTVADALFIRAYDTNAASFSSFMTLTAGNPPTAVLSGNVTSTTQGPGDGSTKIATTAYADAIGALGATIELDNLSNVAINTSLISDTDITDDLGTVAIRWKDSFLETVNTGDTVADTLKIRGRDVDGAAWVDFITVTAANTPTCAFNGDMTSVTQSAADNSSLVATTAYADAAGAAGTVQYTNLGSEVLQTAFNAMIGTIDTFPTAIVTSDGATITLTYEQSGGGDVVAYFDGGPVTIDCTPALTLALTAGTDAVPVKNYVYILKSAPTILTKSTSGFPVTVEYVPVGSFICQTAGTVQTFGTLSTHEYSDDLWKDDGTQNGYIHYLGAWIRTQPATWESGVTLTPTLTGGAPDTLTFATTAGVVLQLHEHDYPAFDSAAGGSTNLNTFFIPNHTTAYTQGDDLFDFRLVLYE